jgi:hypothetical protein
LRIQITAILSATSAVEAMTSLWYTGTVLQSQATPTKEEYARMSIPKLSSEQQTAKNMSLLYVLLPTPLGESRTNKGTIRKTNSRKAVKQEDRFEYEKPSTT